MEKVAISATDLTKIYGEQAALSHGSFVVPEGSNLWLCWTKWFWKNYNYSNALGIDKTIGRNRNCFR